MDRTQVAVLGATGAVGQRFVQLLQDHPWFELKVLLASGKSAGKRYIDAVDWRLQEKIPEPVRDEKVEEIHPKILKDESIELVFSALPGSIAGDIELELASAGFFVFSNASAHRMDPDVPLLVADINPDHLALVAHQRKSRPGYIVTNPNCTVTGFITGLKPLDVEFGINDVVMTSYQALSGAGYPGVPSLDIVGNIIPYIPGEEEKVESECKKILGRISESSIEPSSVNVIASCARVPVRDGHLESVLVRPKSDASLEEILKAFYLYKSKKSEKLPSAPEKPIIVTEEKDRPQPLFDIYSGSPKRAKGMSITVGRIKKIGDQIRFFLLVHNTIRGAAGCTIMNAELAKLEGFL
ncbi:MAG: aspartate-semialdehyde dehydrogenase [Methanomassiliicoccales archaeon]|nr:MAG: aspartate-semialdehyde dehydrogenase [Methanomassiliicoccales archaeon]